MSLSRQSVTPDNLNGDFLDYSSADFIEGTNDIDDPDFDAYLCQLDLDEIAAERHRLSSINQTGLFPPPPPYFPPSAQSPPRNNLHSPQRTISAVLRNYTETATDRLPPSRLPPVPPRSSPRIPHRPAIGRQPTILELLTPAQKVATSTSHSTNPPDQPRVAHVLGGLPGPKIPVNAYCVHKYDAEALRSWIYPMNLDVRDYQFNIVQRALFENTLVVIPTGLGKTFIATVVMYNYYRWFPSSKIVFMAPTKPLVAQQIRACYEICGMSQEHTAEHTGDQSPEVRRVSWAENRVFFLTPQSMQNDLREGTCPAPLVALLVVDEAHRATGKYAYCEVIKLLQKAKANSFRVLALTATPGTAMEAVQEVVDNLRIQRIEARTEESPDIKPYTHKIIRDPIILPLGHTLSSLRDELVKVMSTPAGVLYRNGVLKSPDPSSLKMYTVNYHMQRWNAQARGTPGAVKSNVYNNASVLASLAQCLELLTNYGVRPFLNKLSEFVYGEGDVSALAAATASGSSSLSTLKGSAARREILKAPLIHNLITTTATLIADPGFLGHPKLDRLLAIVLDHFFSAEDSDKNLTRVMVFSQFRDSVDDIVVALSKHAPMVRPRAFIGQASAGGEKGFTQKEQLDVREKFETGLYNVLVSTSIGEEGLDIGEVDLILCYDTHSSPIRMLQRGGRTGRKRQGRIVYLLTEGKEEQQYKTSQNSYKAIQKALKDSSKITLCSEIPPVLPVEAQPGCFKERLEIAAYIPVDRAGSGRRGKSNSGSLGTEAIEGPYLCKEDMLEYTRLFLQPLHTGSGSAGASLSLPTPRLTGFMSASTLLPTPCEDNWLFAFPKVRIAPSPHQDAYLTTTHLIAHSRRTVAFCKMAADMDEESMGLENISSYIPKLEAHLDSNDVVENWGEPRAKSPGLADDVFLRSNENASHSVPSFSEPGEQQDGNVESVLLKTMNALRRPIAGLEVAQSPAVLSYEKSETIFHDTFLPDFSDAIMGVGLPCGKMAHVKGNETDETFTCERPPCFQQHSNTNTTTVTTDLARTRSAKARSEFEVNDSRKILEVIEIDLDSLNDSISQITRDNHSPNDAFNVDLLGHDDDDDEFFIKHAPSTPPSLTSLLKFGPPFLLHQTPDRDNMDSLLSCRDATVKKLADARIRLGNPPRFQRQRRANGQVKIDVNRTSDISMGTDEPPEVEDVMTFTLSPKWNESSMVVEDGTDEVLEGGIEPLRGDNPDAQQWRDQDAADELLVVKDEPDASEEVLAWDLDDEEVFDLATKMYPSTKIFESCTPHTPSTVIPSAVDSSPFSGTQMPVVRRRRAAGIRDISNPASTATKKAEIEAATPSLAKPLKRIKKRRVGSLHFSASPKMPVAALVSSKEVARAALPVQTSEASVLHKSSSTTRLQFGVKPAVNNPFIMMEAELSGSGHSDEDEDEENGSTMNSFIADEATPRDGKASGSTPDRREIYRRTLESPVGPRWLRGLRTLGGGEKMGLDLPPSSSPLLTAPPVPHSDDRYESSFVVDDDVELSVDEADANSDM